MASSETIQERLKAALGDRYRIEREIGAGGMATVYLAEDLKHRRKVALKILRPELAAIIGAERFLKEIEVTANLQHPNILPLYDSGEADGFLYYVMPLIEGETLRDRLDREHQLPVEDAVEIARDVAAAVDYAHRHGVIHRDLKPSNILLHDGQALVADFGIALAIRKGASETRLTETGLSVGTPHYMSPEQAAGDRELDARSDLYSLGAVTYEMLVGEPPHVAKTAQAVVAKILSDTPAPIRRTRELVPGNVEAAVTKALARSPADRFATAADFAEALTNPGFTLPTMVAGVSGAVGPDAGTWRRVAMALGAAAFLLAAAAVWGWARPDQPLPVARYRLAFPLGQEPWDLLSQSFDVAPKGAAIVYVGPGEGAGQLWVKHRDEAGSTPLPGTEGATFPSVSPDGLEVAFVANGLLRKVPLRGGGAVTLADSVAVGPLGWTSDGHIVFSRLGWRLQRIQAVGGDSEGLWPDQPQGRFAGYAEPVPNSELVLFVLCDQTCADVHDLWVLDGKTGEAHELVPGVSQVVFVESGHLVFVREDGAVFAAPFDPRRGELTGAAVPLLEAVKQDAVVPDFSLTADGTLLLVPGLRALGGFSEEAVWVTRDGGTTPVDPEWRFNSARNLGWDLSPDGTRLAIGLSTDEGDDIWIKELDGGPRYRLTYDSAEDQRPRWSSDGQTVYFGSGRGEGTGSDLWARRADGATEARPILIREPMIWDMDMTPDGEWIVARVGGSRLFTGGRDIVAYHMVEDTAEIPIVASEYDEIAPKLSPDGRWLAYASQETGGWEVYVRPFPDVEGGRWTVSRGGGLGPRWAHSGRELFYVSTDREMMVASVDTSGGFRVLGRERLFEIPPSFTFDTLSTSYDVSPDDQRFIMVRTVQSEVTEEGFQLILVENWLEEVKRLVAGAGG